MGADDQAVLLASDGGYGFIATLADLHSKNRAGKSALTLPKGAQVLTPSLVSDPEQDWVAAVSNEGRLLLFPALELPRLARGKGNKIINIPAARVQSREEFAMAIVTLSAEQSLTVFSGRRHLTLKPSDLEHYRGERGRRGNKLPRGFQKVDRLSVSET